MLEKAIVIPDEIQGNSVLEISKVTLSTDDKSGLLEMKIKVPSGQIRSAKR
jgi:hypothetical protein